MRGANTKRGARFWPAFALLPIITAGPIKAAGLVAFGGVDTTALSMVILLGATVVAFVRHPTYPFRDMLPYFAFVLVVLLGVARSEPGPYQTLKAQDFLLAGLVAACVPVLIRDSRDLKGLLIVWLVGGTVMAFLVFQIGGSESLWGRAGINGATHGPAYLCAAAFVIATAGLGERLFSPLLALPAIAINAVALVSIGSRGPMLGAVAGLASWVVLRGAPKARTLLVVGIFLAATFIGFGLASQTATSRLVVLEDPAREDLAAIAWATFSQSQSPLMGLGWGNYATVSWAEWPHNVFLEAAVELGLVGVLACLALIAAAAARVLKNRERGEVRVLAALASLMLVGGLTGFQLTDRRGWLVLAACLALPNMIARTQNLATIQRSRERHSAATVTRPADPLDSTAPEPDSDPQLMSRARHQVHRARWWIEG